jgi:O-antigen ligase
MSHLKLWLLPVAAALGPVYWLPGISPGALESMKVLIFGAAIVSCLSTRPNLVKISDLTFFGAISALFLLSYIANNEVGSIDVLIALGFYLYFYAFPPAASAEEFRILAFRSALIFSAFTLIVIFDFFMGGLFFNPFYKYQLPLFLSGFHGGRTGWAFSSNIFLAITLATFFITKTKPAKFLLLSISFAISLNIILVGSRGGVVVMSLLLCSFLYLLIKKERYTHFIVFGLLLATSAFYYISVNHGTQVSLRVVDVFLGTGDVKIFEDQSRSDSFEVVMQQVLDRPIFGSGLVDLVGHGFNFSRIHNVWLRIAVENGIPSAFLILVFFLLLTYRVSQSKFEGGRVFILMMIVVLVTSQLEPTTVFGGFFSSFSFWLILASIIKLGTLDFFDKQSVEIKLTNA